MKPLSIITALILTLSFASCGDTEFEFSSHRAYFIYDNSQHLDPTLAAAMNAMTPGTFCRISTPSAGYVSFENNQGQSSRVAMTAIEQRRTNILGVYNGSGIIVGYGNLSPVTFYAYDTQCPNCYEQSHLPRYQLSISSFGVATCSHCQRTYDMNNGGLVSSSHGGNKLFRYRADTTGPNGILSVNN